MKKLLLMLVAVFVISNMAYSQQDTMYIRLKKGNILKVAVAEIDSIVFHSLTEENPGEPEDPEGPEVDPSMALPSNLVKEQITAYSALFSFNITDAPEYEVSINGESIWIRPKDGSEKIYFYTPVELTPSTAYEWKVRAVDGEKVSKWAGNSITTVGAPSQYVKVTFEREGMKEVFAVNPTVGGLKNRSLSKEKNYGYVYATALGSVFDNVTNIHPDRAVIFQFPCEPGNYNFADNAGNLFPFADYLEYSTYTTNKRIGDWISLKNGNLVIEQVTPGPNESQFVKEYIEAVLVSHRGFNESQPSPAEASVKIEFLIGIMDEGDFPE